MALNHLTDPEGVKSFSAMLSKYLANHEFAGIRHNAGTGKNGPMLIYPGKIYEIDIWWKYKTDQMLLTLLPPYTGKAIHLALSADIKLTQASDHGIESDYIWIKVPPINVSIAFGAQLDAVKCAVEAASRLAGLVPALKEFVKNGAN